MAYAERNTAGKIRRVTRWPAFDGMEQVADDAAELAAFHTRFSVPPKNPMREALIALAKGDATKALALK